MKICIVSGGIPTPDNLGAGIFEYDQAKALAKYNNVIFAVVDLRSFRNKRKYGITQLKKDGLNIYIYSFPLGGIPLRFRQVFGKKIFKRLMNIIITEEGYPDIVHSHFLDISAYAVPYCNNKRIPIVVTEHWSLLNKEHLPKSIVRIARKVYSKANERICVSSSFASRLSHHTGVDFKIVPNIVSADDFSFIEHKCLANDPFVFVSCGYLIHGKGYDVEIKAFRNVVNIFPDCQLQIIGNGEQLDNLKRLVHQMHLENNVIFLGEKHRQEINNIYKEANAFVLASRRETFGVVYIEAMSAGLPVIATTCGGPEDFVNDENGLLVPVDNVQALSEAMISMVKTISKYNCNKISEFSKKMFSPDIIAERLLNIYNDCM